MDGQEYILMDTYGYNRLLYSYCYNNTRIFRDSNITHQ